MFGRTVKCIYDKQQDYDRVIQFHDSNIEQDNTTHNNRKRNQDNPENFENNNSNDNENKTIHESHNQNDKIESENQNHNNETQSETESNNDLTEDNPMSKQQNKKEYTPEKQNNKNTEDMQKNKQNKTTNNNQNITTRKTKTKTQNHEYTMNNSPPEINLQNYPNLISPTNNTTHTITPETQIPAVIPETQFDEINNANENTTQLSLLSPTLVTSNRFNLLQSTPDPMNSSTPDINNRKDQQQRAKPTPQGEQQNEAKKFA